jgi:hypothetical protein
MQNVTCRQDQDNQDYVTQVDYVILPPPYATTYLPAFCIFSRACAAASLAMGTRRGEQDT